MFVERTSNCLKTDSPKETFDWVTGRKPSGNLKFFRFATVAVPPPTVNGVASGLL
jgi:hypothetical protein